MKRYGGRMVAVILIGLFVVAGFGWLVFGGVLKIDRDQAKAERNASKILDETFDGRPDVTFTTHMRTLKYETVVLGAKERGYRLVHQADNQYGPHTLIFEKVSDVRPAAP